MKKRKPLRTKIPTRKYDTTKAVHKMQSILWGGSLVDLSGGAKKR